ncbi:MAG: hypothetical protein ABIG95_04155 [Candidatus Woesearchaeota archaeon]
MNLLNYVLIEAVCFSGILLGGLLALLAPEEIRPGKKYLEIVQTATLGCILVLTLYSFLPSPLTPIFFSPPIIYLILKYRLTDMKYYPLLALTNIKTANPLFITLAALIFFYGFPTGSLAVNLSDKRWHVQIMRIFQQNYLFLLLGVGSYFLKYFL